VGGYFLTLFLDSESILKSEETNKFCKKNTYTKI